jgi:hypothetical protein
MSSLNTVWIAYKREIEGGGDSAEKVVLEGFIDGPQGRSKYVPLWQRVRHHLEK